MTRRPHEHGGMIMADLDHVIAAIEAQYGPLGGLDRTCRQLAPSRPAIVDSIARAAAALRDPPPISRPRAYYIPNHLDRITSIISREGMES